MPTAAVKKNRPKYLSLRAILFEIRLPLPGWVSILHRVSGALLFASLVWLLFMLDRSLASEQDFAFVRHYLGLAPVKLALLVLIWAYCHHLCAGIRFLLLELQKGWEKEAARLSSIVVFVASLALTALFGAKLW
ncbi:MAG: succinate dehydrogenase, cytochrome b556 subunit [Betaproteobacteria bacterium]|nr:succinate dehydrogenase, cytochrome b556 subunit [Betaproteobacteria bacterium]